jgi:RimJ/RimL family protein N-acetyltransferase
MRGKDASSAVDQLLGSFVAVIDAENERSIRVAERIGMSRRETIEAQGDHMSS